MSSDITAFSSLSRHIRLYPIFHDSHRKNKNIRTNRYRIRPSLVPDNVTYCVTVSLLLLSAAFLHHTVCECPERARALCYVSVVSLYLYKSILQPTTTDARVQLSLFLLPNCCITLTCALIYANRHFTPLKFQMSAVAAGQ